MKRAILIFLIVGLAGCAAIDRNKREDAQEKAVLDAWDKADR